MGKMRILRLGSRFVVLFSMILLLSAHFAQAMEFETDRPGMDYRSFDLTSPDPGKCEYTCYLENWKCRAWTYVEPGVQGPQARCWLKSGVPAAVKNTHCRSGISVSGISDQTMGATCNKFDFVTISPLPSTGVGWDYKYQLQVSGGYAPYHFLTPYYDRNTGVQKALSCLPSADVPSIKYHDKSPYYSGRMMVPGLTLTCDGLVVGQPTAAGNYTVTIIAYDNCPLITKKLEHKFVLEIKGPSPK
jgi:PAN domain-containing protein